MHIVKLIRCWISSVCRYVVFMGYGSNPLELIYNYLPWIIMFYKSCYCSPGQDHMQRLWCGLHSQRRTRCWENYLWWWNFEWIQGNQSIWIVPMFLGVFSTLNCNIYHVRRCFAYWLSTFLQLTKFWKSSEKVKNGPIFLMFSEFESCVSKGASPQWLLLTQLF